MELPAPVEFWVEPDEDSAEIEVSSSCVLVAPVREISALVITCTGRAVSASTRFSEEPVISTRWMVSGADWAWAACMPSTRPPAQIRRTERDKTVSFII
ncbi:hypothetical protein D3C86_1864470 [compost metagenome]